MTAPPPAYGLEQIGIYLQGMDAAIEAHNADLLDEADHLYADLLARMPGHDPRLLASYGWLSHQLGRADDAIALLQRAVDGAADFTPAWYRLGVIRFGRAEWPQAVAAFSRVCELDPDFDEGRRALARALEERGDDQTA